MTLRTYKTPEGFRTALEQRIHKRAEDLKRTFERERTLLVFDRLLGRIGQEFGDSATLKGGFALERRLARARTTKDVDLRMVGSPANVLQRLQAAGRLDLGDRMRFEIIPDPKHPEITGAGAKYGGPRFLAVCQIAAKNFGTPFGIDIGFGDPVFGEFDTITAPDVLDFIGVPPPVIRVYPVETHLAEKLHAYTMRYADHNSNSRVKDLPDLALLATMRPLRSDAIRAALAQTFKHRATHEAPPGASSTPCCPAPTYASGHRRTGPGRRSPRRPEPPPPLLSSGT